MKTKYIYIYIHTHTHTHTHIQNAAVFTDLKSSTNFRQFLLKIC